MLILDADGRIVAVLLGRPEGNDWDEVIAEMAGVSEGVRRRGVRRGVFQAKQRVHLRGSYFKLGHGVTKGPGQKRPGNLAHSKESRQLLKLITLNHSIRRIAGFQSSGLARFLPKLYKEYCNTLRGIFESQPELEHLFPNSVFPAATWNLGPSVVTRDHEDGRNAPHGMCGVTSAGDFNHKRGGHIYLKQLKTVIEFPSGSSISIPSAAITHGNTAIGKGETRYSMTQYAAGELFRWAAYGYQGIKDLLATEGGAEKKCALDGEPGARAAWAIGLLSKIDELEMDRVAVFGSQ
ncbi:hypothetical protein B0H19DRAFT_1317914 [Mycena capillaripes]|nr:hypothetical protein B0H19DRAFT_1317914 [Mycena capillaripes]